MEKSFLLPGEFAFYKEATNITTVLGSCVAVCLFDRKLKIGGMNHFLLDEGGANSRYAEFAIKSLLKEAIRCRCEPKNLQAKIFGGGEVVTSFNANESIGQRNIKKAMDCLIQMRIPYSLVDTGGKSSRRITMNNTTGAVEVLTVEKVSMDKKVTPKVSSDLSKAKVFTSKPKVLIIDDSAMVRRIVKQSIEVDGRMEVCGEAEDPFDAREKIIECTPDVICLDIMMPKMNGLEFLKRIMHYKPIPTVVLSTLVKEGNRMWIDLKKAGALALVNKDDMKIYKSDDNLNETLLPKLYLAARTRVVQK